ncbi:MAG: polysaccharide pyruvyl transferase family protein, partial [Solirubrobacteraceae bacterium]|nr:polysaccharide pyruvyl transferase family protein [Solirubrobacteraceae bacterium]
MSRIVLAGAFGQRNPGDDALLDAFLRALDGHEVVATSAGPAPAGCEAVAPGDPAAVMRRVRAADAVVLAGGTVFKELRPATGRPPLDLLARALALGFGTRALGKPLALVGVGAAPLRTRRGRLLARRLVGQASLLVLRDEESAQVLADAGAPAPFRIGADAAWTVAAAGETPAGARGGHVVVALSHDAGDDGLADELAATLVPVLAAGREVVLQPWQVGRVGRRDDIDLARAVNARLGGTARIAVPPADLGEARAVLAEAGLVVAQRFHALVAAGAAGAPAVAYAHEPKLAGLARRLGQPALAPGADPGRLGAAIVAAAGPRRPPPPAPPGAPDPP